MKTILAPVDFTQLSYQSSQYAADLATAFYAKLVLLHVVNIPVVYGDVPMPVGNYDELIALAENDLKKLANRIEANHHQQIHVEVLVKAGAAALNIREAATELKAFCVVMSTRGLGSVDRFLLGSTTLELVRNCGCPVLVLPSSATFKPYRKIGFASDFDQVLKHTPDLVIKTWMQPFDAILTIIHNNPLSDENEPIVQRESELLGAIFQQQRHIFQWLHEEYTETAILEYAKSNELDLLITVPKKHGFFDTLLGHKHTKAFVLQACLPLLVVPAD